MRALLTGAAIVVVALALAACGGTPLSGDGPVGSVREDVPADETTRRIAAVEAARVCSVGGRNYPTESGITDDLESRLAAAELTYAEWKNWHDELATSPELVDQLEDVGQDGCPGGDDVAAEG